jgi:hypothetical protein
VSIRCAFNFLSTVVVLLTISCAGMKPTAACLDNAKVDITCPPETSPDKPTANDVCVYEGGSIEWAEQSKMDFLVKFKNGKKTPLTKYGYERHEILSTDGHIDPLKAEKKGDYKYWVVCSNGKKVDPQVRVPPKTN